MNLGVVMPSEAFKPYSTKFRFPVRDDYKTPEALLLEDEDSHARHKQLIKLALAILMQAIEDATADVPPIRSFVNTDKETHNNVRRKARDEARTFLLTENVMLQFWCWVAGIQMVSLLHYARKADKEDRWVSLGEVLRASKLHHRTYAERNCSVTST